MKIFDILVQSCCSKPGAYTETNVRQVQAVVDSHTSSIRYAIWMLVAFYIDAREKAENNIRREIFLRFLIGQSSISNDEKRKILEHFARLEYRLLEHDAKKEQDSIGVYAYIDALFISQSVGRMVREKRKKI